MIIRTDPIADMLTRIRNAQRARHETVAIPLSVLKWNLGKVLESEGYISSVKKSDTNERLFVVGLKYLDKDRREPLIQGIVRKSTPGQRLFVKSTELPRVLNGLGIAVISTSKGLMTNMAAKKNGLGGEVLCEVW